MTAVRIGFLGLGTVGTGTVTALRASRERIAARVGAELIPVRAAVRDLSKPRPLELGDLELVTDPLAVATADDIDLVVEAIGGVGVAFEGVKAALAAGKSVVTANKELLARHAPELVQLARAHGADLVFEPSVAGGIPILQPLRSSLSGNQIHEVVGIINGTTNYILSAMTASGRAYDDLLAEAQAAGYAEADPTADVEGHDASYKLAILAMLAFDTQVSIDDVEREGITRIAPADIGVARQLGYVIKLLGIARQQAGAIELRVHPTLVRTDHPLANVSGANNAIFVRGSAVGELMFYGPGAGSLPTGSAVVGELVAVARNLVSGCPGELPVLEQKLPVVPADAVRSRYYVRMRVADQPGVLAGLAGILGEEQVSVAQMIQTESESNWAEIVWITHPCPARAMRRTLERMERLDVMLSLCNVLRTLDAEG